MARLSKASIGLDPPLNAPAPRLATPGMSTDPGDGRSAGVSRVQGGGEPAPESGAPPSRPVILLVDDSGFVRTSLARRLGDRMDVRVADSGERAWERLLLDPAISAVLSDLNMPGLSGFELLGRVRHSVVPRIRALPFVILSGTQDESARERAHQLGADRFALKGVGEDALADWLLGVLRPGQDPQEPLLAPVVQAMATAPIAAPRMLRATGAQDWLMTVLARLRPSVDVPAVLFRLHAVGVDDLQERLRRGIRAADALHLDESGAAWLCASGSASHALRLALRFGVLAGGREAAAGTGGARVEVCLQAIDPLAPLAGLQRLGQCPAVVPLSAGLAVRSAAAAGGVAWDCQLPWPAARLLVSA